MRLVVVVIHVDTDDVSHNALASAVVDEIDQVAKHEQRFVCGGNPSKGISCAVDVRYDEQLSALQLRAQPDRNTNEANRAHDSRNHRESFRPSGVER